MRGLVLSVLALWAVSAGAATQVHYVMGTYLRVTIDGPPAPAALADCFARARGLDRLLSRFDPTSELVAMNARGGGTASPDLRAAVDRAVALGRVTDGAFDVTVGALARLWQAPHPPTAAQVAAARATLRGAAVTEDAVVLAPGTVLDFDGVAKGMAVDDCVQRLRRAGVRRALVSFGESSLYAIGAPAGAPAWTLDVRGPDPEIAVAELRLRDAGASVSAVFGAEGRRSASDVGHIIDPGSGRPLADDVVGVVVAPTATDAEAYSKAVLVWGPRGLARAERTAGVQAARVWRDHVERGAAMRRAGALAVFARPRPLDPVETALR